MSEFLSKDFDEDITKLNTILRIEHNFDIKYRTMVIGNKKAAFYCIDGFIKADVVEWLQEFFYSISQSVMPMNEHEMSKKFMPYIAVDMSNDEDNIIKNILSGMLCFIVEGYEKVFLLDCRQYPARSVQEPEKYKVLRGSRDGFVESLVSNLALIRRRIRSTDLSFDSYVVGEASQTDVCVCYMDSRVDKTLLKTISDKINNIKVDALTMNQESLAECIYKGKWYNPFPKFKYSERPDATVASILEGAIILLVDNSPAAIIIPTTIFDVMEEADDYYFPPVTGTYLRFARTFITFVATFLTPIYLLLVQNPAWVPEWLEFINVKENIYVPILLQLLILELAIDGLKLAAINTPSMLNTPLSIIAALIIGEFSIKSGWFNAEVMLYMAVVAIANFTHESYELGYALKFARVITLILTRIFNLWGFVAGIVLLIVSIASNKTLTQTSYLYPLFPFDKEVFMRRIFRVKLKSKD